MHTPEPSEIVLVGDIVEPGPRRANIFDWDNPTWAEVRQIQAWLEFGGVRTQVISAVSTFPTHAAALNGELILPLWRGGASRSRTSIVPAVCEALGLAWIGADAFAQSVCQDKSLAKHYLRAAGIACADDVVIRAAPVSTEKAIELRKLALPVVVKPLLSACSIGISADAICRSLDSIISRTELLFSRGLGPVICEPFIEGDEVSICVVEKGGAPALSCIAGYRTEDGSCPFTRRVMTFEDKVSSGNWTINSLEGVLEEGLFPKVERLLEMLGPVHLIRLDGRLRNGVFTAIELTPDIHLGLDSIFLGGFSSAGVPPWKVLHAAVNAALCSKRGGQPIHTIMDLASMGPG